MDIIPEFDDLLPKSADKTEKRRKDAETLCPYIYNGAEFVNENEHFIGFGSSMIFGLMVYDNIMCKGNEMLFGYAHYKILNENFLIMGGKSELLPTYKDFDRSVKKLCYLNKYPEYSRLEVYCWQDEGIVSKVRVAIRQYRIYDRMYELDNNLYIVKSYTSQRFITTRYMQVRRLYFEEQNLKKWGKDKDVFDVCLLNEKGAIMRTTMGNIYLLIEDNREASRVKVVGVSNEGGAYRDVISDNMGIIFHKLLYSYEEVDGITPEMCKNALAAFVVGSVIGIKKLNGIDNERYAGNGLYLVNDIMTEFYKTYIEPVR